MLSAQQNDKQTIKTKFSAKQFSIPKRYVGYRCSSLHSYKEKQINICKPTKLSMRKLFSNQKYYALKSF